MAMTHSELLEDRAIEFQRLVRDLGDFEELLRIWRHPGWTTPAELYFASGVLDAMVAQIRLVIELKAVLLNGSEAVIAGG
jgi:hypothetical protein